MVVNGKAGHVDGQWAGLPLLGDDDRDRAALDPRSEPQQASAPQAGGHNGGRHALIVAQNAPFSWVSNQSRVSAPMCFATTVPSARMTQDVGRAMSAW